MLYLPRWIGWVAISLLSIGEIFLTYLSLRTGQPGFVGWLAVTGLVLIVGVVIWLTSSGRLPAFVTRG
jgi:hypothetical protein